MQKKQMIKLLLLPIILFILLHSCSKMTKEQKEVITALTVLKDDPHNEMYYQRSKDFIQEKWQEDLIDQMDLSYTDYKIYNNGVFSSINKDTLFILTTGEFWFKNDVKVPDSIKNKNERFILTQCFLGFIDDDSIYYENTFNSHIYGLKIDSNIGLYNESYRNDLLLEFTDFILKEENTSFTTFNGQNTSFSYTPYKSLKRTLDKKILELKDK